MAREIFLASDIVHRLRKKERKKSFSYIAVSDGCVNVIGM
jgi:hypothetical protein